MDPSVLACLLIIIGSIALSYWKRLTFTMIGSIACIVVYIIMMTTDTIAELAFQPGDLVHPDRLYTLLTSMFSHSDTDYMHIIVNLLSLVMFGLGFEQRIGTRPFVAIFLITGLVGTLTFAALRWDTPNVPVVGASGAILGILGGYARLYPRERVIIFPFPPMPLSIAVIFLVAIQFLLVRGTSIAWESHIGGLLSGLLVAPFIVKVLAEKRSKPKGMSVRVLHKLAVTPELRGILSRIEKEELEDVRNAWIDAFVSKAKCPQCGASLKLHHGSLTCDRGHQL